MTIITVQPNQNPIDIAMQYMGNPTCLFDLMKANNKQVGDAFLVGEQVIIPDSIYTKFEATSYLKDKPSISTGGLSLVPLQYILQENGRYILQENGRYILL